MRILQLATIVAAIVLGGLSHKALSAQPEPDLTGWWNFNLMGASHWTVEVKRDKSKEKHGIAVYCGQGHRKEPGRDGKEVVAETCVGKKGDKIQLSVEPNIFCEAPFNLKASVEGKCSISYIEEGPFRISRGR